jgi:aspartate kinase
MSLIVQKYGGTSVGSTQRIEHVASKIKRWCNEGHSLVVVTSAMSGETDRLIGLARAINPQIGGRELDVLLATGEQVTIALLSMALEKRSCRAGTT